jgi:hypothetical protein
MVTLLRFPDAKSAKAAAQEMDETDFAVSADNVRVQIDKYPDAHGHWRPFNPSMAVTLAHGDFVIHILAVNPTTNYAVLTGQAQKTFDLVIPKIDSFKKTAIKDLGHIPRDPDNILGRTQYEPSEGQPEISGGFVVLGPNVARQTQEPAARRADLYGKAGIDRIAMSSDNNSYVFRARDARGANLYISESVRLDDDIDHPISAPAGLADAKCFEAKRDTWRNEPAMRYACFVTFDRFVGVVTSGDESDVKLRAASQFALLVNDL